jgi:glycosyltransferase involved in cell wall biosynthesis
MKSRAKSFAFVGIGDYSSANERILAHLSAQFPELEPDLIDLRPLERSDAFRLIRGVARDYGMSGCLTKRRIRERAMRTQHCFRRTRTRLLERLSRRRHAFTFQTQSLFDASIPGTPHFVYTDHTHLANLTYPAASPTPLAPDRWCRLERSIYHNARMNFTMSAHISRSLVEQYGCPPSRVHCVYGGSNVAASDLETLSPERFARKRILFVGIDWERKGGPVLIEAFREVRRAHPTAELIIVGCTPKVSVPGCRVVGRIPLAEVAEHYRAASVFCLPTRLEPFGYVFLEAFAHGLPVIATNIGAIPDFVEEGVSGHRVGCDDAAQLAKRLIELLGDPARCAAFGARGQALVNDRYTWRATAQRMAAQIRPLIQREERGRAAREPGFAADSGLDARLAPYHASTRGA